MVAALPLVFVHGSGRAGRANWLDQQIAFPSATYLSLSGFGDEDPAVPNFGEWVAQILDACGDGAHVVAHSYGAIPVALAAATARNAFRSMILMEPALYSLGRGAEHVENYISRVSPVVAAAPGLTAAEFEVALYTAFGISAPPLPTTADELRRAERLRLLPAPWDISVSGSVFAQIPTLIISGGWNAEYEEIASALVRLGATHRQLAGFGHRIQDHPKANEMILNWVEQH